MKMRNDDIVKLTEIKQYFLQPPYSFKLATHSLQLLAEATETLHTYTEIQASFFTELETYRQEIIAAGTVREKLVKPLFAIGKLIGSLNNK